MGEICPLQLHLEIAITERTKIKVIQLERFRPNRILTELWSTIHMWLDFPIIVLGHGIAARHLVGLVIVDKFSFKPGSTDKTAKLGNAILFAHNITVLIIKQDIGFVTLAYTRKIHGLRQ